MCVLDVPGVLFSKHWWIARRITLFPQQQHDSHVSTTNEPRYCISPAGLFWMGESDCTYRATHSDWGKLLPNNHLLVRLYYITGYLIREVDVNHSLFWAMGYDLANNIIIRNMSCLAQKRSMLFWSNTINITQRSSQQPMVTPWIMYVQWPLPFVKK